MQFQCLLKAIIHKRIPIDHIEIKHENRTITVIGNQMTCLHRKYDDSQLYNKIVR